MSFLRYIFKKINSHTKNKQNDKNTLQAQFVHLIVAYTDTHFMYTKRMSSVFLKKVTAGITAEAAVAIPFFLFFMINLISLINIFNTYGEKLSQAQQMARTEAFSSYILGGTGDDIVSCKKSVPIKSWINEVGYESTSTSVTMSYRRWTGYDVTSNSRLSEVEEYVYITEHGYSYHKNRGCSHLNIKIEVINKSDVDTKRNSSRGKYYPCERCGGSSTGLLFITQDGDRYHSAANCSGLKRNIRTVKISEVGSRTPCATCGG